MLEKIPIFAGLDKTELNQLEEISRPINAKRGSVIFSPGDTTQGFYALTDGAVRIYSVSSRGKEITQRIVETGNTFAEASVYSKTYQCFAQALTDSTVCLVQKEKFLEVVQLNSQLAATWIRFLSNKILHMCQRIETLSLKSPKERIASYLLLLSELQNTSAVKLPVHRKTIATLLGMTHETFYRTTKELEKERVVQFDKLRVEILNQTLLEKLIE